MVVSVQATGGSSSGKYWIAALILFIISIITVGIAGMPSGGGPTWDDVDTCRFFDDPDLAGYPEYDNCEDMEADAESNESMDLAYMCGFYTTCCGSIIMGIVALFTKKPQHIIIQQPAIQYVQPVVQQVVQKPVRIQQPVQTQQPAMQTQEQFLQQKKMEHLKRARQRELARDYEAAIREYEAAEEFSEAGRIREMLQSQGKGSNSPVQVNIGQVGNSVIQDSVVMNDAPAVSITCVSCGQQLDAEWKHCPYCNTPRT
jgi:hypothetical protein